jgi:hypothetical protein
MKNWLQIHAHERGESASIVCYTSGASEEAKSDDDTERLEQGTVASEKFAQNMLLKFIRTRLGDALASSVLRAGCFAPLKYTLAFAHTIARPAHTLSHSHRKNAAALDSRLECVCVVVARRRHVCGEKPKPTTKRMQKIANFFFSFLGVFGRVRKKRDFKGTRQRILELKIAFLLRLILAFLHMYDIFSR